VTFCLKYPGGTVGFAGTSTVSGRVSGFAGSSTVLDFNNAARLSLLPAGSQTQFSLSLSMDRCVGAPVPSVMQFSCAMKDAADVFGQPIDPPTIVSCTPTTP
jgi:hypothetical protein